MNIFIPTFNRPDTINSHNIFKDAKIIVHNEQQKKEYLKNKTINPQNIIVSGVKSDEFGLSRQREWITNNLVKKGEWFVFADDDIKDIRIVSDEYYNYEKIDFKKIKDDNKYWNEQFSAECDEQLFFKKAKEMIAIAEKENARMCGFATTSNFFFRAKKIRLVGYCQGGTTLMKSDDLEFDHTITMEDFRNTAYHLLKFGVIILNNFIRANSNYYKNGGMGNYDKRLNDRKKDVKKLIDMYPGLFAIRERPKFEYGTDLKVVLHSKKQIEKWRKNFNKPRIKGFIK